MVLVKKSKTLSIQIIVQNAHRTVQNNQTNWTQVSFMNHCSL